MGEKNRYDMQRLVRCFFVMVLIISFVIAPVRAMRTKAAKKYSSYVTNISVRQTTSKITVSYTAKAIPNGTSCYIGYETPGGYVRKRKQIGKEGKHTVSWRIVGGVSRVYTELIARNYKQKDTVTKVYKVATGTKYHQVTRQEELAGKLSGLVVGAGIGAISLHPAFAAHSFKVFLAGNVASSILTFKYTPEYPQYIKMTTRFDKRKENLKTTVTVYTQKGGKQLKKWTTSKHIGF